MFWRTFLIASRLTIAEVVVVNKAREAAFWLHLASWITQALNKVFMMHPDFCSKPFQWFVVVFAKLSELTQQVWSSLRVPLNLGQLVPHVFVEGQVYLSFLVRLLTSSWITRFNSYHLLSKLKSWNLLGCRGLFTRSRGVSRRSLRFSMFLPLLNLICGLFPVGLHRAVLINNFPAHY